MKSILRITGTLITIIALLQSCTREKDIIAPVAECADTNVSFDAKVQPILQANCFSCHGNGSNFGNVSLQTYDNVKQLALSGRLLGAISHSPGFSPMPKGAGKLSDCNINAVATWIKEGAKDN